MDMPIARRTLLSVAFVGIASPIVAAPPDVRRTERAIGNPSAATTVIECFSLTCPHCANFAQQTLPELKTKWIAPGRLRWVFYDFPTDGVALQAAMVARTLPPDHYEPFIDTLFATQDRWAYGAGGDALGALWNTASQSGMDRATFEHAIADTDLRDWIVGRAMDAEKRWNVDATPSFLVNGKLYAGDMSAAEFASILGS
jgi:protein-disulfide isomerase